MSTLMLKNTTFDFTPVSNIFIEQYMPKARGKFIKVYLLLLKYTTSGEPGVNLSILASSLNLLESDIMNALHYWSDVNAIKLDKIDNMNNYGIEFLELTSLNNTDKKSSIDLLEALDSNNTKGMLKDIELLLARPLSPTEMSTYLGWQKDFGFSSELILILIEYCISKGNVNPRYIEKVALAWHDQKVKTVSDAQNLIKKNEDTWITMRSIMKYLGLNNAELMQPQREMMEKWISTYKFPKEIIEEACKICSQRLNRADFKYIDGILSKWYKNNIRTLEDIKTKDFKPNSTQNQNNKFVNEKPSLRFNNFEPRDYDYDSLEKKLLGWDNDD